ncbi:long-chain fatty acid transport protein 4-like isoform X1 [Stylophora pistillata]|uniref:long-chain fatty acid transport protein 4-like isoform X1 n=1 Tax=Stylophora pistillata TaxID=50429 RepID=UPI000C053986|nr:long-chain fatty acid transport protein 4-like isoform X1 [Stylophora pistillata]
MAYTWPVIVAGISFLIYYKRLPWFLFPCLLFGAFLASGGKYFPRVFFRTILRDLRLVYLAVKINIQVKRLQKKGNVTVADIFRTKVSKHPRKAAFIFEQTTWTFQDVEDFSNRIGNYFKSQGYKKGDVVALFLDSCPEFVCIWLGLSKIGVITALINSNLRLESLKHCVSAADPRAVIFGSDLSDAVRDVRSQFPEDMELYNFGTSPCSEASAKSLLREMERSPLKPPPADETQSFEDVLMYIYTSGTTGYPKAAVITHLRFFRFSKVSSLYSITTEDILYCTLPLYHSAGGAIGVGSCLLGGITLVLRKKFSASKFWEDCIKHKVTAIQYIGELCRYLLAQPHFPSEKQHSVRVALGNGLRPQIWNEFQSRFGISKIGEFYGSTEGNVAFFNIDNTPCACGFVSIIFPKFLPFCFIKVDPITGEVLRDKNGLAIQANAGEPGLVVGKIIKEKGLKFDGYLNQQETAKKICHNIFKRGDAYFLTGDLLIKDEYGYVYFHDRLGDTFRWRGENVSTAEVEAIMSNILSLRDVVVYGVQVPGIEGRAGMAAIADPLNKGINLSSLVQGLKEKLPSYACPIFLRIIFGDVGLTGTFKLQKTQLRQEGFDVGVVKDKLFYYDSQVKQYVDLDEEKYAKIVSGEIRM